jgi:hypothetical protein
MHRRLCTTAAESLCDLPPLTQDPLSTATQSEWNCCAANLHGTLDAGATGYFKARSEEHCLLGIDQKPRQAIKLIAEE